MISISALNVEGFTGEAERVDLQLAAAWKGWRAQHPDANETEAEVEGMRLVALADTTIRYADIRNRLAVEEVLRSERDRLLDQVEKCWNALTTATAWLAAHHAYVLAVDEARIGIDMWRERAETARERHFYCSSPRDEAAYRQIQEAGHPQLETPWALLDKTPTQTADALRFHLDQSHERRTELASQTARLVGSPAQ
ncbi:hypothetical protein [Streptomyces albidoflavus]|uniref:hypothetical protein n=1 Tax=Streptomyces albidoflavus TaxID=1886 RepID=UPI00101F6C40|nr:hypothetical protein [Streptomyces albidoflavus]RZF02927.1 hypothetical protein C0R05_32470 [Streptomyces albidoflavus]